MEWTHWSSSPRFNQLWFLTQSISLSSSSMAYSVTLFNRWLYTFSNRRSFKQPVPFMLGTHNKDKERGWILFSEHCSLTLTLLTSLAFYLPCVQISVFSLDPVECLQRIYFFYSPWTKPVFIFQAGITREIWKLTAHSINKHGMGTQKQNTVAWHRREGETIQQNK